MFYARIAGFFNIFFCLTLFNIAHADEPSKSFWQKVKGTEPANRLYLGMWSVHLTHSDTRANRWSNKLIAGVYRSFFLGTFINSYDDRAYAFGIQRNVWEKSFSPHLSYQVGYRIGGVTGYDERLLPIAAHSKVMPFAQVISDFTYRRLGWEIAYTGAVVSTDFYFTFG